MNDHLASLVAGLEACGHDPAAIGAYTQRLPVGDVIDLVEAHYVSVETLGGGGVSFAETVREALQRHHTEAAPSDTGGPARVVCLAGIDDPEAAVATLHNKKQAAPDWRVEDGYLIVEGASPEAVTAALVATRK